MPPQVAQEERRVFPVQPQQKLYKDIYKNAQESDLSFLLVAHRRHNFDPSNRGFLVVFAVILCHSFLWTMKKEYRVE